MPRDKATEPEPTKAEPNFTPADEELTAPTSNDVGEQTATAADEDAADEDGEEAEEGEEG